MEQQVAKQKDIAVKEIRREKIHVPKSMTTTEVMEKYGLKQKAAANARQKGFFVKNYSRPQVCIDPTKFDADVCYRIAGKVFKSNLSRDPVARSIRDDLIQEAVTSMWEKSGLLKESKKYNINYQYYFVARNYMNSYLSKWKRQMRYYELFEDIVNAIQMGRRRAYDPAIGWMYC